MPLWSQLALFLLSSPYSLEASTAAAPSWAEGRSASAPFLAAPADFYRTLRPMAADTPLEAPLVICRVVVTGQHFDSLAAPDLRMAISVGQQPAITQWGAENSNVAFVSTPVARLASGDTIGLVVHDRDMFEDELVGSVSEAFPGFLPLSIDAKYMSVDCRGITRAGIEALVPDRFAATDGVLARLDKRARPTPAERDWGYPHDTARQARTQLEDLAAMLGWHDGRVARAVASYDNFQLRWQEQAVASVAAAVTRAPAPGQWVDVAPASLRLKVVSVECGEAVRSRYKRRARDFSHGKRPLISCAITIEALNQGGAQSAISTSSHGLGSITGLTLVAADGRMTDLQAVTVSDLAPKADSTTTWLWPPGTTTTVVLMPRADVPITTGEIISRPRLLRLSHRGRDQAVTLLRLQ